MNEFERFTEYWEQAVHALAYRIRTESSVILTQKRINAIWQEELLTKRFRSEGVKHGARIFLDELEQSNPALAQRVLCQLMLSEMPVGANGNVLVGEAVAAAAFGAAAASKNDTSASKNDTAVMVGSLLAGGALAVKTAVDAMKGSKNKIISALNEESVHQLKKFAALFAGANA